MLNLESVFTYEGTHGVHTKNPLFPGLNLFNGFSV